MEAELSLQMEHLRLRVRSDRGMFGADIPLGEGLVILRAENSRGKSTAVKSLLYALGMERMIAARAASTMTAAMRDHLIFDPNSKAEASVLESYVSLEISNDRQQTATVTRWVKHSSITDGLMRITNGPSLTRPGNYSSEDYYVGRAGSVANPRGFHRWLAEFIGWNMPNLPARDGRVAPLYMEQVLPLLFVEQRRGWGGIQAQMPYFSGVSDVRKRAIEFLLDLEIGRRELERQQLIAQINEVNSRWKAAVDSFERRCSGEGLSIVGVPREVTLTFPGEQPPFLLRSVEGKWTPLASELQNLKSSAAATAHLQVQTVREAAPAEEAQLQIATERAERLQEASLLLREEIIRDRAEVASITARLEALQENQREYQDVLVLERLGSSALDRLHDDCPVCHQSIPPSLLGSVSARETMSAEDSLAYIREQINLFDVMVRDSSRALAAKTKRWAALRNESMQTRAEIRRLRTDLTQQEDSPSIEQVAKNFLTQQSIDRLEGVREDFAGLEGELRRLAEEAAGLRSVLSDIPKDRLSSSDRAKIDALESSFISQLREYDFGSFSDERLAVAREDYLPRRDDFDLQADISASDSIRVVWAYLMGLMEVSKILPTNHPGFLVFDEPRQQSAKEISFRALLHRAASVAQSRQILFATSENLESLERMLEGQEAKLNVIEGYLLKPIFE